MKLSLLMTQQQEARMGRNFWKFSRNIEGMWFQFHHADEKMRITNEGMMVQL